jgi:flagellar basal-body rod modification protein FlgD
MAIDSNFDVTSIGLRSASDATAAVAKKKPELGQEDFLSLMIAQFRNQDPMHPVQNGEFLSQLAQFSSVAGLTDLKNSFADLSSTITSNQTLQASSLLGRSVLVAGDKGYLGASGSVSGAVDLDASAQSVVVQVTDSGGAVVQKVYLGAQQAGLAKFTWDGTRQDGTRAAPGTYTIKGYTLSGTEATAQPTLTSATVESVTLGAGQTGLMLSVTGLGDVALSDVRQIS